MAIKKIVVLYGGESSEREVSLKSGQSIYKAILALGYQATLVDYPVEFSIEIVHQHDYVFIALHGQDGESGALQSLLSKEGILYSGSNSLACQNTWNKKRCKELLVEKGISTPKWLSVKELYQNMEGLESVSFESLRPFDSLFLKPEEDGSSIDVFKVSDDLELRQAIALCIDRNRPFIFEESIDYKELTVPILNGRCLPPIEIITKESFYNYAAKYVNEDTVLVKAELSEAAHQELELVSIKTYEAMNCRGWARIDLLEDSDGSFYVMEVNTVPGMTSHSLFPKSGSIAGLDYNSIVQEIIDAS